MMNINGKFVDLFTHGIEKRNSVYSNLGNAAFRKICLFTRDLRNSIFNGGKVVLFGNGGSAADCDHIVGELRGRYLIDRPSIMAMSLSDSMATTTAIGNDFGYENVFLRQLMGIVTPIDSVIALSTSGISKNVVLGLRELFKRSPYSDVNSLLISGKIDETFQFARYHIMIPIEYNHQNVPIIQETTMFLLHFMCELIDYSFEGIPIFEKD